jgi:hypothetical protein
MAVFKLTRTAVPWGQPEWIWLARCKGDTGLAVSAEKKEMHVDFQFHPSKLGETTLVHWHSIQNVFSALYATVLITVATQTDPFSTGRPGWQPSLAPPLPLTSDEYRDLHCKREYHVGRKRAGCQQSCLERKPVAVSFYFYFLFIRNGHVKSIPALWTRAKL